MRQLLQPEGFSTPASCAACRRSIRQGSQSFYLASLLLPVEVREPAYAVYAFCRTADDFIDREQGGTDAIAKLGEMLDRIYARQPGRSFVERGFADVVSRFAIPRAIPDALIEGLAWDAAGRRYRTLDELKTYAVRVAGTVGFMMTLVMGRRRPDVLARACDLGVAMQLTNIARESGEDAASGRVYVPLDWLADAGIGIDDWFAAKRCSTEMRLVAERLLGEAEALYARSLSGIAALPPRCRLGMNAARLLYRGIGQEILRGVDPVATRAVTSKQRKLCLFAEALVTRTSDNSHLRDLCLPQADFLVKAVQSSPAPQAGTPFPAWWDVKARSERMIDMLTGFSARTAAYEAGDMQFQLFARSRSYSGSEP